MPRWLLMWVIAFTLYAACKWLTWRDVRRRGQAASLRRTLGYLFAWPGMDAPRFFCTSACVLQPSVGEWFGAVLKTVLGIGLAFLATRITTSGHPLAAGWVGMAGIVFVLHFGVFHLLSLAWREAGVDAWPVMRNPLRSASLAEFWGRRWNTAFHLLAVRFAFAPLQRRVNVRLASIAVFLLSGLIHELVITLPAGGGYGLPTLYFAIQGIGSAAERTSAARRAGLGHGWRGWLFTVAIVAGPAFWLFPPRFIHAVILPMFAAAAAVRGPVMTIDLPLLLRIAGVLHLGLMCAGLLMPRVVDMRAHLSTLPAFLRQLFWVYYTFIGLCLLGFSAITVALADTLAAGGPLARALCAFLAVFWTLRLIVATFVFDLRPYLTSPFRRLGYHATNVAFAYLPVVYAMAALRG
jgi:hypothetical protein